MINADSLLAPERSLWGFHVRWLEGEEGEGAAGKRGFVGAPIWTMIFFLE